MKNKLKDFLSEIKRELLAGAFSAIVPAIVAIVIYTSCSTPNGTITQQPMIRCPADQSVLMMDVPAPGETGVYKYFWQTNSGVAKEMIVETFECPQCGAFYFTTNVYRHIP